MPFFEFCYMLFGILDFIIVFVLPIFDLLTTKRKFIATGSVTAVSLLSYLFFPNFAAYIVLPVAFTLIFFLTGKKLIAVCLSLFNYLLSIVLSYVSLLIMEHLFHVTEATLLTDYYIPYYIFLTLLFVLSSYAIRIIYNSTLGRHLVLPKNTTLLLLGYLSVCTLLFVYNYSYEAYLKFPQEVVQVNSLLFFILFLLSVAFIIAMMHILKRDAKLQAQNAQYENLQQYTEQIEELYQNIRGFKHDYINILSTMQLYIEQENWDDLRSYFNTEILPTEEAFQCSAQALGPLSNLQVPEVKSALYSKLVKALELELDVHLEIRNPIQDISMTSIDLVRIIGIYLDNAIEALLELDKDQLRKLSVALIDCTDSTVIIIQNNCPERTLNLSRLGTLNYSTKGENRGMGLYLASKILRTHTNVQKETIYENGVFTQTLRIPKC